MNNGKITYRNGLSYRRITPCWRRLRCKSGRPLH
nr:MAG TPA: hypothetical protein [Caudoviricetes sp.]DAU42059.1 MAG TPA: hypothetical protein [Caudoviricetes sp.]